MTPHARRRLRWLVPALVVAGTAAAAALPSVLPAGADPVPVLPALTPAQLLQKVHDAHVDSLSGDVTMSTNLGLPDLGALGVGGGTALDLIAGTHTAHVWYDGAERVRLALDSPQAETDWIRNGSDVWSWDSSSQAVKHATLEPGEHDADETATSGVASLDPIAAADELLAAVDPTTEITVRTPGYVAGRPVYELVVTPRSAASTVADGVVSIDAATGLPLAVRIDAKGSTTPAVRVSFTSISFDRPAASVFEFTPPPGAHVTEATSPADLLPLGVLGRGRRDHIDETATIDDRDASSTTAVTVSGATRRAANVASQSNTRIVGTAWDSVAIVSGVNGGRQLQQLFANSPAVTVGSTTGHLVSTRLVNVLVLDDGRIAVGAVTPEALVAAVASA